LLLHKPIASTNGHSPVQATRKRGYGKVDPPFGYFGSKNKIALQIINKLPPHNAWVEAFCGSAAVTLAKPPTPIEVINDIDDQITNLFTQLRENQQELIRQISLTPYAREELNLARNVNGAISDLERARKFLVASMMSINGILGEDRGGFSYSLSFVRNGHEARVSRWYNLPERLSQVVERLRHALIEKKDARKLLETFIDRPATLVYLDPPYFVERTNGYNVDANTEVFHKELLELANKAKCMIFISGYDNKLYKSLLTRQKGWTRRSIPTHTKDPHGKIHSRTEVLWMNRYFQLASKSSKAPIRLSSKEKEENKINPKRPVATLKNKGC